METLTVGETLTAGETPAVAETLTVDKALALLENAKTVAICSHVNPDGDALGSALALAALLRARGCEVACLLAQDRPAPALYGFLNGYEFLPASSYTATPDLFVALDLPGASRLGDGVAVLDRALHSLCIDHHPNYTGFTDSYYGDEQAAATASLVWDIIKESGITITPDMAAYCYVAVMTDTGRFAYQNTNVRTFLDAAEMVEHGADPTFINTQVYGNKSIPLLRLESRLIERMSFSHDNTTVYSWVEDEDFKELGVSSDDTESLPIILRSIADVKVAALLRAEKDKVRVNLRSRCDCDVGELACRFGGGGHRAASGFTYNGSLDETINVLSEAFEQLVCTDDSQ
ncbi:MAG: DHH family phosphoesterase [Coriobacteriia bacterium]|nr:DHH family phosphoesterase [Coriobacteriia bacterium]